MTKAFAQHRDAGLVLHLAGQVAVTTSVIDPRADFEAHALGTLNALEALRQAASLGPVIDAATTNEYGGVDDAKMVEGDGHNCYTDRPSGLPAAQGQDVHSPCGCIEGPGDRYMRA